MLKNTAGQKVGCQMITAADGSPFTGTVTVYVTGDAGTQALGSVGSGVCTHEGNGYHTYAPAQAETNYDLAAFTFVGTGAINTTIQIYTNTGDAFARIGPNGAGLTALPWNSAWNPEVQSKCNDAIVANHLNYLFLTTYDPASKPGAADALLNELVESDSGVARFTANALEQGPAGASVWTTAGADPLTTPAATASFGAKIDWIHAMLANDQTQTKTLQTVAKADGTVISEAAVTSDGTTVTREKFANP